MLRQKSIQIASALFTFAMLFCVFTNITTVNAYSSAVYSGTSYVEQCYDLNNASFTENVEVVDGCLQLEVNSTSYLPTDGDEWTEDENYADGTNAWWYPEDVASNATQMSTLHKDIGVEDSLSVSVQLVDTGATGFFISFYPVDPATYDISEYERFRWYLYMYNPISLDEPLTLDYVLLSDNNTVAKYMNYSIDESVNNSWMLFDYALADFTTDEDFGANGLTSIKWHFSWDVATYEDNATFLWDHLAFYKTNYEDNGTFISNWINPAGLVAYYTNLLVWTTKINATRAYVSQDGTTWIEVSGVTNGSQNVATDNLVRRQLGAILNPRLNITFKIFLNNTSTPAVDFVILEYIDLTLPVILLLTSDVSVILPNDTMNLFLWVLWGIGSIIALYDVRERLEQRTTKKGKARQQEKVKSVITPILAWVLLTIIVFSITTIWPAQFWNAMREFLGYEVLL